MSTEPIEALQVALKQVALQITSLGLNSIIDGNGNHRITTSITNANAIAGCEWALRHISFLKTSKCFDVLCTKHHP